MTVEVFALCLACFALGYAMASAHNKEEPKKYDNDNS